MRILLTGLLIMACTFGAAGEDDPTEYVEMMTGTSGPGEIVPAAS